MHEPAPKRPVLFVNPRSGGGTAMRAGLVDKARARGIQVIVLRRGDDLAALADEAVAGGADMLGVAGGDGSLAVVAAAALAQGVSFVCVPAGTRNHFALDLGLDRRRPAAALDAFTDGIERRIDVAEVNGRIFLNNVSLGVYGEAVRQPAYRDAKVRTLLETVRVRLGPTGEAQGLRVSDDVGRAHTDCSVVLVSNNPYAVGARPSGRGRPALDTGRLGVIVVDRPHAAAHPPARAWTTARLEVEASGTVHAGVDGEAVDLTPPLDFGIRPGALRVRLPAPPRADHPERVMTAHPARPETA